MVGGYGGCLWAGSMEVPDPDEQIQRENEDLVRRFIEEIWNKHNLQALDEFVSDRWCRKRDKKIVCGYEAKQLIREYIEGCPSVQVDVEELMPDEDLVLTRLTVRGTDRTGKLFSYPTAAVYRVDREDGRPRIVKSWHLLKEDILADQIGQEAVEAMKRQGRGT